MLLFFPIFVILTYFHSTESATTQLPEYAEAAEKLEFLVTNKSEIWRASLGGDKRRYLTNTNAIGDVDYHLHKNILFWIDTGRNEICSQSLNANVSADRIIFKQKGNWEPVALAIDFINDKIYVVDGRGVKIDVFELDGQFHSIVLGSSIVHPTDIKLDPHETLMFVLDGYKIIRTHMDGSDLATVIKQDIRTLHGFTIDTIAKKLYWLKKSDFSMMSSNYWGTNISTVKRSIALRYFYTKFAVFNGTIYWTRDFVEYTSECCDEKRGMKRKTIYQSNPVPTTKVIHSSLQVSSFNPCAQQNGGCQHLCILKSKIDFNTTHRCACKVGWKLADNVKNCTLIDNFLIYTQLTYMKSHLIENCTNAFCEPYLPISQKRSRFVDFDYDQSANYLYYIVQNLLRYDTIYRIHPNDSDFEVFLNGKQNNYQSLSIDGTAKNMYYIDPLEGSVNVIKIDDKSKKIVLLETLENPEDIVIHSNAGYIFFLQTNQTSKISFLSRANVDGTDFQIFDNIKLQKLCGFVVDSDDDKVYVYDWRKKYVQIANLSMQELGKIENIWTKHIYIISIFKQWIYVVTTDSEGIQRFDKASGDKIELIVPDFSNRIAKIKVFSSNINQNDQKDNPCYGDNGGCAEFCFALPSINNSWTKNCISANHEVSSKSHNCVVFN